MADCLFCKIIEKKIPAKIAYEDAKVLAFHDIGPQAPVHVLIIPKEHIPAVDALTENHKELVGHMHLVAQKLAKELKISKTGYRLVINNGQDAGQAVAHLHLHLLGGRKMQWPPG
jgi:histidine triad (HIT) family protein